jgi:hypothetical protein
MKLEVALFILNKQTCRTAQTHLIGFLNCFKYLLKSEKLPVGTKILIKSATQFKMSLSNSKFQSEA